jgi:hypothetical protein
MLVRKTISTFYYALKNYLRKWIFNILLDLYFKPYASIFARELFYKRSKYQIRFAFLKVCFEIKFKYYFIGV